jgi:hypothetical protein
MISQSIFARRWRCHKLTGLRANSSIASIVVPGSAQVSTNFLGLGGATNSPARYYRVHFVP